MKKSIIAGMLLALFATPCCLAATAPANSFSLSNVEKLAASLAKEPYQASDSHLPEDLANLDYDHYNDIHYKTDKNIWKNDDVPFELQLFHRGYLFKDKVLINIIDHGKVTPLAYSPDLFDFGKNKFSTKLSPKLGFAGFRIRYFYSGSPEEMKLGGTEVAVFLGASYFRAVGVNQYFGLSARALAIDTGLAKPEEFPVFKEFWLQKPTAEASSLTFYGLLDSPSVTGAYRFVLHPGADLTFEVTNHLYFRQAVERVGVAPITSMFLVGKNKESFVDDYRPEVHDSDGLLLKKSNDEYVWRPLINFKQLLLSVFKGPTLHGFGLLQRERDAKQYQDFLGFERRPSLWVEPLGHWSSGAVHLIEIPSDAERYDNIAAFWVPDELSSPGKEFTFHYRLHFLLTDPAGDTLGKVISTRIGGGEPVSTDHHKRRFVIDFQGGRLATVSVKDHLIPAISTSAGSIDSIHLEQSPNKKFWRLMFELNPDNNIGPIELQATLKKGTQNMTETWLYQWHRMN